MISRTILTLVALLCSLISVNAQDYIITKNGEQIQARVAELSSSEVKYKKWSNLNGPLYTIKISDIARINYENGTSDVFSDLPSATRDELPATIFADRTGTASDTDLMALYNNKTPSPKIVKRLKLTAWIGGGILLTFGVLAFINDVPKVGALFTGGSAVWFTGFYLWGVYKQKQNDLSFSSIYKQNIFKSERTSLDLGLDYIHNRTKTKTLGLGLTYNF